MAVAGMHAEWSPFSCTEVFLYSQVIMALYVNVFGLAVTFGLNLHFYLALRNHPSK